VHIIALRGGEGVQAPLLERFGRPGRTLCLHSSLQGVAKPQGLSGSDDKRSQQPLLSPLGGGKATDLDVSVVSDGRIIRCSWSVFPVDVNSGVKLSGKWTTHFSLEIAQSTFSLPHVQLYTALLWPYVNVQITKAIQYCCWNDWLSDISHSRNAKFKKKNKVSP